MIRKTLKFILKLSVLSGVFAGGYVVGANDGIILSSDQKHS